MIRLAHVSDIHLTASARWRPRDLLSKRLTGWLNLRMFGRGRRFRSVRRVLAALDHDLTARHPDALIFSGDAGSLGFAEELAAAAELLRVGRPGGLPGVAVPGNHDYYCPGVVARQEFEGLFGPWLDGVRVDAATYPFARRLGPVWLVAVNSSQPTRWPWDSRGRVGADQIDRLRRLFAHPDLADGAPRVLVTHYPIARAHGQPEIKWRGLRDLGHLVETARAGGVALWLHGHRHRPYFLPRSPGHPIPSICVGSGTQERIWTYAEYATDGRQWHVQRRRFDPVQNRFVNGEAFTVPLAAPAGLQDEPPALCRR